MMIWREGLARRGLEQLTRRQYDEGTTLPATLHSITARDVLISHVHDGLGSPMYGMSHSARDRVDKLWTVTAEGKTSLTLQLFTDALDAALTWAAESGGEIYRRDQPGADPELYKAAW